FVTAISKEAHHVFKGYASGAVDYLFKPLNPVVLRSKVEVFVELYERGRAVAQREELLRATFEDAPIGMGRADADGRLRLVNRALCGMLARHEDELVGRTLDELGIVLERGIDVAARADLLAGRSDRYEIERRLKGPAGTSILVGVSASLARTPHGETPELILHIQDLRARERAERDREQLIRAQLARATAEAASERLRVTQSIGDAVLGADDLAELLGQLMASLLEAFDVDRAAIVLSGGEGQVTARASAVDSVLVRDRVIELDDVAVLVAGDGGPVAISDVQAAGIDASSLGPAVRSLLAVPLIERGEVLGSLHVGTLTPRDFDEEATELLRLAAARASLAIARVRLHEREHKIAEQLQRSLLPHSLPSVPGLSLAARYLVGGSGTSVGGDWYDAVALPGGRVGVAVGDVVGRGIEAASTMGQIRSALRAFLMQEDHCGAMADRLNRFALGLGESNMTTVLLAILEPGTGRLRYTNAGHPPALVVAPDGSARYLNDEPFPPLGVLQSPRYPQHEVRLEPGSTVVIYTDGLIEQATESLDVGLERLLSAARDADSDVDALCERLLAEGGHPRSTRPDDVTLLALHAHTTLAERIALPVSGEPGALAATRAILRRWLSEAGAGDMETHDITMACNEACENAIEHAYGLGSDILDVEFARSRRRIEIFVRDYGTWQTSTSHDRGRGLPLMRELMDDVDVQTSSNGTCVRLCRRLAQRAAGAVAAETGLEVG
ncbi:MAG: SpoIIE family protein phosphatase, partial [Actinomycetota bacterium]|nr:SpoIIE family protein phosphatase [Actinomycetota bacterium]